MLMDRAPAADTDDLPVASEEEIRDELNPFISNWDFYGPADALADTAPIEFLIPGFLPRQSLGITFGAEGSLKSMFLLDMCLCMALGIPWLEPLANIDALNEAFPTKPARVLWLDFDNGRRRMNKRLAAFLRAYHAPLDTPIAYVTVPIQRLDMSKRDHALSLVEVVERKRADFLVIDNLLLVASGAEENSSEMAEVMNGFRTLNEHTGVTTQIIHHQRKSNSSTDGVRRGETLRGHSSIAAACDVITHVDRKEGSDAITVTPTKKRDYVRFEALSAMFTYEHFADTNEMEQARFWGYSANSGMDRESTTIMAMILDIVTVKPEINQQGIVAEVRARTAAQKGKPVGRDRIIGLIKRLVDDGKLEERKGEKSANRSEAKYRRSR